MLIADLVGWWYVRGWAWFAGQVFVVSSRKIAEFFSVTDLLKTLFSPFRQDTLETKGAPASVKLQALGGNLVSRVFGFIVRTILIFIGLLLISINLLAGAVLTAIWPLVPLSPVIAVVLTGMELGV